MRFVYPRPLHILMPGYDKMFASGDNFPASCDGLYGEFCVIYTGARPPYIRLTSPVYIHQVNLLSVILNAAPITDLEEDEDVSNLMQDSPQCMTFVLFMIWSVNYSLPPVSSISLSRFASVTVNLGPTFLSGALAANAGAVMDEPSCPLVQVRRGAIMERCHLSHSSPGSLQTLCSQCHLDPDKSPLHHVDHLPPEEAVQGLHQNQH